MMAKISATKFKIIVRQQQGEKDEVSSRQVKPEWLEAFLEKMFFSPCQSHPVLKNEKSRYCVPCDLAVCQYCVSSGVHKYHKTLKVYRHVYQNVVLLAHIDKDMDCSQIQPYKCNKKLVLSLNPLPHSGLPHNFNPRIVCKTCTRRLYEPQHYSYCSIACKVKAFKKKSSDLEPPFLSVKKSAAPPIPIPIPITIPAQAKSSLRPVGRVCKRKGVPCRAPLL